MREVVAVVLAFLLTVIASLPVKASTYNEYMRQKVLLIYTVREIGSGVLDPTYSVAELNNNDMHTMEFLKYDAKTQLYTTIDILKLPPVDVGHLENQSCKYRSHPDGEVIAWYKSIDDSKLFLTNPQKVWRANRKTGKFEVIPDPRLVGCFKRFDD